MDTYCPYVIDVIYEVSIYVEFSAVGGGSGLRVYSPFARTARVELSGRGTDMFGGMSARKF